MTEIQKQLLQYLKEIDVLCRENDIEYYLAGGTLLGAIRHEGFLPWDDDADILMTRTNWLKFIDLFRAGKFRENRVLEGPELDDGYPNVFGRYIDISSTAIHTNQLIDEAPAGMPIDVFPLDPITSNPVDQRQYLENLALYSDIKNNAGQYSIRLCCNHDRFHQMIDLSRAHQTKELCEKLEKDMYKYREEECDVYALRWAGCGLFSEKRIYGKPKDVRFEDAVLMAPQESEEYLFWHYGPDWMMVPAMAEQQSHNAIYNFETDYATMRKEYFSNLYNKNTMENAVWHRKKVRFENMDVIHARMDATASLKAAAAIAITKENLKKAETTVEELIERAEYSEILRIFNEYIEVASSRQCVGREDFDGVYRFENPIRIDLPQGHFEAVITALYNAGHIGKTKRMLDAYEKLGGEMTAPLKKARRFIVEIGKADVCFWKREYDLALPIVEKLLRQYPDNQHLLYMKIYMMIWGNEQGFEIERLLNNAINRYPQDGELYKCLGDYHVLQNRLSDALIDYFKSSLFTANGCLALEIRHWAKNHRSLICEGLDKNLIKCVESDEVVKAGIECFNQRTQSEDLRDIKEFFLDYWCDQVENDTGILSKKLLILIDLAENQEELAKIESDLRSEEIIHNPTREIIRVSQLLKAGVEDKNIGIYLEWDEAYISNTLKKYIERKEHAGKLSIIELRLLADAYFVMHQVDTAFDIYRYVLKNKPDSYTEAAVNLIFKIERKRMLQEYLEGTYPKHILKDAFYKRFGENIYDITGTAISDVI